MVRVKTIKRKCDYCLKEKKRWRMVNGRKQPNVRKLRNGCWACNDCLMNPKKVPTIYVDINPGERLA